MLHAFEAHKISDPIREQLWNSEDAKTSSIIGTLSHLPARMFWNILYDALVEKDKLPAPDTVYELIDIEFWPFWKLDEKVEPDVFLQFDRFDLILELKRNDNNRQYSGQWKRELEAYQKTYPNRTKPCYLIAISGRTTESQPGVYPCSWTSLLNATRQCLKKMKREQPHAHEVRILNDAVHAFHIHHEYPYCYFDSMDYEPQTDGISEYNDLFMQKL